MPSCPPFLALLSRWNLWGCSWDNLIGDRHWPCCSCYPSSFGELCRIGSACCYWRGSIAVVVGVDVVVLCLKNCSLLTEALVLSLQWVFWPQRVFSPASLWLHILFEPGWPSRRHHSLLLRTLSPFPPAAVQGVWFLFPDFGRLVQVFRGLSVGCHTASGVLCCYARNWSPGLQRFVGACLVSIGGWQFHIRTDGSRHHSFCKYVQWSREWLPEQTVHFNSLWDITTFKTRGFKHFLFEIKPPNKTTK